MGADGGICWIKITDRAGFDRLTEWFAWRVLNTSAQAYKSQYARDLTSEDYPIGGDWIEGGYGTDCEYDLQDLLYIIEWCLDPDPDYYGHSGHEDVRGYTFEEVKQALLTDPSFDLWGPSRIPDYSWWKSLGPIFEAMKSHLQTVHPRERDGLVFKGHWPDVPDHLKEMTLREWGLAMAKVVDIKRGCCRVETWT